MYHPNHPEWEKIMSKPWTAISYELLQTFGFYAFTFGEYLERKKPAPQGQHWHNDTNACCWRLRPDSEKK